VNPVEAMDHAIWSRIHSQSLSGKYVFLSASFPNPARRRDYFESSSPFEITDATVEAAAAILAAGGKLLSGGHPTIAPLLLSVARDFLEDLPVDVDRPVHVFQSSYFEDDIPEETRLLEEEGAGEIHFTKRHGQREESLLIMRREMLRMRPVAAILIGGMEGVYDVNSPHSEYTLFTELCAGRPVYPIAATGGAARLLWEALMRGKESMRWSYSSIELNECESRVYPYLMTRIIEDIIAHELDGFTSASAAR